jgi:hypothetical protein
MAADELNAAEIATLLNHTTLKTIAPGIRANIRDAMVVSSGSMRISITLRPAEFGRSGPRSFAPKHPPQDM